MRSGSLPHSAQKQSNLWAIIFAFLLPYFELLQLCSAVPLHTKGSSDPPSVKAVSSKIKRRGKSSRMLLVKLIWYAGWNRMIIEEVIIKGLGPNPRPRCLSARLLEDIGRQMGPISPFASRPHCKSRWVMAPGSVIRGELQIGGGLITSLRRCVMKLSAPSELSTPIPSRTPSLLAFIHHCLVNCLPSVCCCF